MSGTLRLRGSTSGYAELQAAAVAGDQTFILPAVGGTLLTTDSPIGNLTLELGSASAPSLRFEGDTDTGLFSSSANTLNLVTGGSNKLVLGATAHTIFSGTNGSVRALDIDSSGNVGIGTASPGGKLAVYDASAATFRLETPGVIAISHSFDGTDYTINNNDGSGGHAIIFGTKTSGNESMRIDQSGNIYVNDPPGNNYETGALISNAGKVASYVSSSTTGSDQRIYVYNGSTASYTANINADGSASFTPTSGTAKITLGSASVSGGSYTNYHGASGTKTWFVGANYNIAGALEFWQSTANGGTTPGATPAMVLNSSGYLGIGQSNPTRHLEVGGSVVISSGSKLESSSSNGSLIVQGGSTYPGGHLKLYGGSGENKIEFCTSGASTSSSLQATLDGSGRLLVNTTESRVVEDSSGNGPQGKIQIEGLNSDAMLSIISAKNADTFRSGCISLGAHRGSLGGTPTVLQNGDTVGAILFAGGDGTDMRTKSAQILSQVDGTPGSSVMPGRLVFSTTADGAGSPTESMRLTSSKQLWVNATSNTNNYNLLVNGPTRTSWFTCDSIQNTTVNASTASILTINGFNPTFVQVYIKVNFAANGALQAHFDYELITCDAQGSGGTTTIRQSLNESVGSFQVSTSDFAVTKSGQNITITYTNQASGVNQISYYVKGLFDTLSIA